MDNYGTLEPGQTMTLFDSYNATSKQTNTAIVKVLFRMAYNRITVYFVSNISGQSMLSNVTANDLTLTLTSIGPNTSNTLYYTTLVNMRYTNLPSYTIYDTDSEILSAADDGNWSGSVISYPITYHYENSTVSGPSEAAIGDTVTVSAVPNNNYGITDPASQILVTNNDVAVSYNWNPTTNTITFTMPDPT